MSIHVLPLLGALRRISQSMDSYSKYIEHNAGLTLSQLLLLEALRQTEYAPTAGALAREVALTQATVSTILDRLETRGLVRRLRSRIDRRKVLVRLTAKGRKRLESAPSLMHADFIQRFEALDAESRNLLTDSLDEVANLMRAAADTASSAPHPDKELQCADLPANAGLTNDSPISVPLRG